MTDTVTHILDRLDRWAEQAPDRPALHARRADGSWRALGWAQYRQAVRDAAKGLIALGVQPGDCVAIVGNNRYEWVVGQFAIMTAGAIPAPIYPTSTTEQFAFILAHSRSQVAICDSAEQRQNYRDCLGREGVALQTIVTMDEVPGADAATRTFADLLELGRGQDDAELDARRAALDPLAPCLLIYTSGTTGTPKAVQVNSLGMETVSAAAAEAFPEIFAPDAYRVLSYLPLCHIAEQVFSNINHLRAGGEVFFCPDLSQIKDYLGEVRPTLFLGVPRVWEKFETALRANLSQATGLKAKLAAWAMATELAAFDRELATGRPVRTLARRLANRLVIDKVKLALGLDRLTFAATGSAPIGVATQRFFASLGIVIYEAYGMSETTGVLTITRPGAAKFGTVGKPILGVDVRIAEDGEILGRGPNCTLGYLRMPAETAELIDAEGWIHTGDLGAFDADGNLRITGRKKDLLITAGGKNVAPAEMEALLKAMPGVGHAVVVGDRQPYLCALLALDPESLPALCTAAGVAEAPLAELATNPQVVQFLEQATESACNVHVARYQSIKKIRVVPNEFSVEGGEITPTMKVKRNVVNELYAELIASMYAD